MCQKEDFNSDAQLKDDILTLSHLHYVDFRRHVSPDKQGSLMVSIMRFMSGLIT